MTRRAWAATLVAAVALIAAVVRVPPPIRSAHASVAAPRESFLQRDLHPDWWPQRYIFRLAVGSMSLIPRGATYTIVKTDDAQTADIVRDGLLGLLQYALMPRRYTGNINEAQYVITWDHPSE